MSNRHRRAASFGSPQCHPPCRATVVRCGGSSRPIAGELLLPIVHELRDVARAIAGPEVRLSNYVEVSALHDLTRAVDEVT